jgi:AcrR family transcriptional regulator
MGARTPDPRDRRVLRTRHTLREALLVLLHERGWDAISVQDLCDRANVGRSTFYTHFADKEELLVGGFDDLRTMLRAQRGPKALRPSAPLQFARGLIQHAHENQRLFRALVGKRSGQVVVRRFRELLVDLVLEDLASTCPPGPARDAAVHFLSGGFLELLSWSLDTRSPPTPEALERAFLAMSASALVVARGAPRAPPPSSR